jgi:hypothetical protein
MANEGPSLTKATYDKKRTRGPAPSPARLDAAINEKIRAAAESRRSLTLMRTDLRAWFRELGLDIGESKPPPAQPIKRRRV